MRDRKRGTIRERLYRLYTIRETIQNQTILICHDDLLLNIPLRKYGKKG